MLDIELHGLKELTRDIARINARLGEVRSVFRIVGEMLRRSLTKSMTAGTDPDGKPLAPVARWTRTIRLGTAAKIPTGKLTPLVATGQLRASMGTVAVSRDSLEFGYLGRMLDIAGKMIKGTPGYMRVKKKSIRDAYSGIRTADKGHDYARIQVAKGKWITKQIQGRNQIKIKPRKREFYYLSQRVMDEVLKEFTEYAERILA